MSSGSSFSANTSGEAKAFDRLARSEDASEWLTEGLIRRWLPVALIAVPSNHWPDLIRACWGASTAGTEQALALAATDQARRYERLRGLGMIPTECWPGPLTDRVCQLLGDESIPALVRADLLEALAWRDYARAVPAATEWARRPPSDQPEDSLRRAGRGVLLCSRPEAVLGLIEGEFEARGRGSLEELEVLAGRSDLPVAWGQWPLPCQERFAALLVRAYPYGQADHDADEGWRGSDFPLLRSRIVESLLTAPGSECREAVDRLASLDPGLMQFVRHHRAAEDAAGMIATARPDAAADPAALPLQTALRLLDRRDFRLIRSEGDLLDAIVCALAEVQEEVGYDLPLLYGPPVEGATTQPRRSKTAGRGRERQHLREDALQAYLRRRLKDVLSRMAEGVDLEFVREEQVLYRRRFDLRVTAPSLRGRGLVTVVIEVKWSTNHETRSSLVDQLGRKYLLAEGHTHGVFLAGWSGWWDPGERRGKVTDIEDLRRSLLGQRDAFCAVGQPGHGLQIEPVVLDLGWHRAIDGTTTPPR